MPRNYRKYPPLTAQKMLGRCTPEGDCLLWGGYSPNQTPKVYDIQTRKMVSARGMLWSLTTGKPRPDTGFWVPSCGNRECISPKHAVWRSNEEHAVDMSARIHGGQLPAAQLLRRSRIARAKRRLTDEQVADIIASNDPCSVTAARHGVSKATVSKYRRGAAGATSANNPWAQLLAAR